MTLAPEFLRFMAHLHRGGTKGYWCTFDDSRSVWYDVGTPSALPEGRRDVYFGVHATTAIPPTNAEGEVKPPSSVRSQFAYIAAVNCLYGDYDAKLFDGGKAAALAHIDALAVAPSVVIASGGGYHCYWLLAEPFILATDDHRQRAKAIQAAWPTFVGSDKAAKDLARVLRVPGTKNYKYTPAPAVEFVRSDYTRLYDLDALEALLPVPAVQQRTNAPYVAPQTTIDDDHARRYALGALERAHQAMLAAVDGTRHGIRLSEAYSLAGLMPHLSADEITDALAVNFGADTNNAMNTIRDGIREGQKAPRTIPAAPAPAPAPAPSDNAPELERLRAENARLRARVAKLESWREWSNAVIAKPGSELSPAAKLIALSNHAEMEYRQQNGITEPAAIFIQEDCKRAGVSPDTYGKKLQELATAGALAYEQTRDTTTGHRRVSIAPAAYFTPALWTPPAQRNHGGTRIKQCVECGSDNLIQQTTVYCVECGVAQGEPVTRPVNTPEPIDETFLHAEHAKPQDAVRPSAGEKTPHAPTIPQLAVIESSYSPSLIPQVAVRPPQTADQPHQPTKPHLAVRPSTKQKTHTRSAVDRMTVELYIRKAINGDRDALKQARTYIAANGGYPGTDQLATIERLEAQYTANATGV